MASRIKAARQEREWSQSRLIGELERCANRRGLILPSRETMKSRVSRWENNHAKPDEFYRQLLREALGLDDRELGFDNEGEEAGPAAEELRAKLATSMNVDGGLVEALRSQTEAIRVQDRQYGAGVLLEQMRGHVGNLELHLGHAVFESSRQPLARLLADASALAGWQALDVGAVDQAWRFFETASRAAQQGEDHSLHAFARLEQAHVLAELTHPRTAAQLTEAVWARDRERVAPSMRCWMAAAAAEMLAESGEMQAAIRMITVAEDSADALTGERPPYLVFDSTHLDRWIGHTLSILSDPAAEPRLRLAGEAMDTTFTRASASLNLDLAVTLLRRGERAEARLRLAEAEQLARKVGSRRQLSRLQRLRSA